MMKRKWMIPLLATGCILLAITIYINNMPDDGIRSKWKKLLLKTLLPKDVKKITVKDAYAKKDSFLFLDTRSKEEYTVSHIQGAHFTDYKEFDLALLKNVPKDQPIITYCSIGKRSGEIGKKLQDAGYTNVQNLYGGIFEWVNNELPVVDAQEQPTRKVHAYNKAWGTWLDRGEKVY